MLSSAYGSRAWGNHHEAGAFAARQAIHRRRVFCAGIGLVRLAIERRGWRVAFANDIDPDKREMYEANFGVEHFHLGDIHALKASEIPPCDLFTASFPCNDLSIAGAWKGLDGKESSAFWGLIHPAERKGRRGNGCPWVLLENVVGFLQSAGGKDFETAFASVERSGLPGGRLYSQCSELDASESRPAFCRCVCGPRPTTQLVRCRKHPSSKVTIPIHQSSSKYPLEYPRSPAPAFAQIAALRHCRRPPA